MKFCVAAHKCVCVCLAVSHRAAVILKNSESNIQVKCNKSETCIFPPPFDVRQADSRRQPKASRLPSWTFMRVFVCNNGKQKYAKNHNRTIDGIISEQTLRIPLAAPGGFMGMRVRVVALFPLFLA